MKWQIKVCHQGIFWVVNPCKSHYAGEANWWNLMESHSIPQLAGVSWTHIFQFRCTCEPGPRQGWHAGVKINSLKPKATQSVSLAKPDDPHAVVHSSVSCRVGACQETHLIATFVRCQGGTGSVSFLVKLMTVLTFAQLNRQGSDHSSTTERLWHVPTSHSRSDIREGKKSASENVWSLCGFVAKQFQQTDFLSHIWLILTWYF